MSRILLVGPAHPYRGGIADFNERLAIELQKQQNEVEILSFSLQYPSFLFPGKSQTSQGNPPPGIKIYSEINSINPFNWIFTGIKIRRRNYDLIIFRYWLPFFGPAFGTISRIAKKKATSIIAITDNGIPHEKRFADKAMGKYFLQTCQGFLSMSKAVCDDLRKLGMKQPMALTPHPMYDIYGEAVPRKEALKKLGLSAQYTYILFFGFVRKYKGLDLLLKAFANVTNPTLKLIIAGEYYEDASYYEQLILNYHLTERVIHYGKFIEDKEVPLFFCAANLLVQPYRSATQSGVAQIAYFYNLPMIVTNVGGLAEIVPNGKTGYCVNPEIEEIANAIEQYFEKKQESAFRQAITTEKKRFTWEKFANSVNELRQQIEKT